MKELASYLADKGSLVVNGVCLENGVGDGEFDVLFFETKAEAISHGFIEIRDIWIDLRYSDIRLWKSDCDTSYFREFTKNDLNADAVLFFRDADGNIALVKYF